MQTKKYALITGASEGFGKALALECAQRKMNLILVALPGSGLSNLAAYIEKNFDVKAVYFEHDLTRKDECYRLFHEVTEKGLSVNILINNAGMGGTNFFEERDAEFYYKQIELNVIAPTLITRLFLKNLEEHGPASILNVSSMASFFYLPKKQVYGGTKSYLLAFSKSLGRELKRKNVFVSTICPGAMNTSPALVLLHNGFSGLSRWAVMKPEDVAKIAINGMLKRKKLIIPGFWNRLFMLLDKIIPVPIKELITDFQMQKIHVNRYPEINTIFNPLKTAV